MQVGVSEPAVSMQFTQNSTGHLVHGKTNIPVPDVTRGSLNEVKAVPFMHCWHRFPLRLDGHSPVQKGSLKIQFLVCSAHVAPEP